MSRDRPDDHDAGDRLVRALVAMMGGGAALLAIALAFVMSRWPIV